jgi:hypothetical protein
MTLSEVNDLVRRATAIRAALDEFRSLLLKKHETWTIRAYHEALSNLQALHADVFEVLFGLEEVREELGEDPLVNLTSGTMSPRTDGKEV